MPFIIACGIVVILIFWLVGIHNRLVTLRNRFKNAFSQIDVQLKRRHDLIPNLVEVAKGYLSHERETLEAVIAARNQAAGAAAAAAANPANAGALQKLMGAEAGLSGALGRLFAVSESYPQLKGDQTMHRLMEELASTENKISFSRQHFNDMVMEYNIAREVFPASLFAGLFGFRTAQLFELEEPTQRDAPEVSFDQP